MKYNVFTDFHHAALLNSLIMLFEGRLGGNLYRPIGTEWFKEGFWKVYDHPATVEQFLGIGGATADGTPPLNDVDPNNSRTISNSMEFEWYNCKDIEGDKTNKAIHFWAFMKAPIDIVIASIPQHIEPFKKLCELHPNHPKLIFQIGNAWTIEAGLAPNIMASAIINDVPSNIHFIRYHQEFDLNVFHPVREVSPQLGVNDLKLSKNIYSFVNVFNGQSHFAPDWQLFEQMEQLMPDWNFKSYGGQCRDGSCNGTEEVAAKMREAKFIWHTKAGGDGFGHSIHTAAACGKPLIVKKEYYQGKMAEPLIIDGKTAIVIDNLDNEEIKRKIEYYSDPERYIQMCKDGYENFKKVCDFDKEFKDIEKFLAELV